MSDVTGNFAREGALCELLIPTTEQCRSLQVIKREVISDNDSLSSTTRSFRMSDVSTRSVLQFTNQISARPCDISIQSELSLFFQFLCLLKSKVFAIFESVIEDSIKSSTCDASSSRHDSESISAESFKIARQVSSVVSSGASETSSLHP